MRNSSSWLGIRLLAKRVRNLAQTYGVFLLGITSSFSGPSPMVSRSCECSTAHATSLRFSMSKGESQTPTPTSGTPPGVPFGSIRVYRVHRHRAEWGTKRQMSDWIYPAHEPLGARNPAIRQLRRKSLPGPALPAFASPDSENSTVNPDGPKKWDWVRVRTPKTLGNRWWRRCLSQFFHSFAAPRRSALEADGEAEKLAASPFRPPLPSRPLIA
jgi:hypothetical protein